MVNKAKTKEFLRTFFGKFRITFCLSGSCRRNGKKFNARVGDGSGSEKCKNMQVRADTQVTALLILNCDGG